MTSFSPKHLHTLTHLCDTFIPSFSPDNTTNHPEITAFWQRKASDLQVAEAILQTMATMPQEMQAEFKQVLNLFDNPLFLGITTGHFAAFHALDSENKEKVLQTFANHFLPPLRQIFSTLKKLSTFIYYGTSFQYQDNPNWKALQYAIPNTPLTEKEKTQNQQTENQRIIPIAIHKDSVFSCDVLIIGSGAGGGVVAGELSKAGLQVIVVDKGIHRHYTDYNNRETESVAALYDSKGLLATKDGAITIFAGSNLGGGTTINWAGSLQTPDYILEEWAKEADLPFLLTKKYQEGFEEVMTMTHVNTQESPHNKQNQKLWQGSEKLGHLLKLMPRNVQGCLAHNTVECGYCSFGCRHNAKMSVTKTYLQEAFIRGTQFLTQVEIEKLTIEQGKVTGAVGTYRHENTQYQITIKAKKVVMAAGAIYTPILLQKSGLKHEAIGKNLYLHPTAVVSGLYNEEIKSWQGVMMSAINDEFARMTENFGFKIETPPVHAGLFGLGMPWLSAKNHKELMLKASQTAHFIILTRDKFGGTVKANKQGHAEIRYKLHDFDKKHLLKGFEEAVKIHLAAGATETFIPHNKMISYKQGDNLDSLPTKIQQLAWQPNRYGLFSAHQMGTCRMGGNAKTHAVSPTGETYEVKNLFVADASLFPRCSGVNPMLSIQALAYWVAQEIKAKF
jgi:choline dehydrogenase-like flavoprotein